MDSTDLDRLERRTRWAYERARLRRAVLGFAPVLLVVLVAVCLGQHPLRTVGSGCGMFLLGVVILWYGRDLRRAVLPGLLAGFVPLASALIAARVGHVCLDGQCTSLCLPACTLGGLVAGTLVGWWGERQRGGPWLWAAVSGMALFTGGMGCVCIGGAGLVGLGVGYSMGVVPAYWVGRLRGGSS
jgi:hypothetical protein